MRPQSSAITPKYATIALRYFRDGGNTACGRMINSTKFSRAAVCFREHNSALLPFRGLLEARNRCGRIPPSGALSAPGESTCAPEIIPCDCSKLVIAVCQTIVEDDVAKTNTLAISL